MTHRTLLTVRFADVDPAGIVYYPRFLHYCHVAMEEHYRAAVGTPYAELLARHRLGFPAVAVQASFRRPLRYGDEVAVDSTVTGVGASSIGWRYELFRRDPGGDGGVELVASSEVATVCVGLDDLGKREVPGWLRERLAEAHGEPPPEPER
jgi:4-hydroxybenzoyl-CoA thioesterase